MQPCKQTSLYLNTAKVLSTNSEVYICIVVAFVSISMASSFTGWVISLEYNPSNPVCPLLRHARRAIWSTPSPELYIRQQPPHEDDKG